MLNITSNIYIHSLCTDIQVVSLSRCREARSSVSDISYTLMFGPTLPHFDLSLTAFVAILPAFSIQQMFLKSCLDFPRQLFSDPIATNLMNRPTEEASVVSRQDNQDECVGQSTEIDNPDAHDVEMLDTSVVNHPGQTGLLIDAGHGHEHVSERESAGDTREIDDVAVMTHSNTHLGDFSRTVAVAGEGAAALARDDSREPTLSRSPSSSPSSSSQLPPATLLGTKVAVQFDNFVYFIGIIRKISSFPPKNNKNLISNIPLVNPSLPSSSSSSSSSSKDHLSNNPNNPSNPSSPTGKTGFIESERGGTRSSGQKVYKDKLDQKGKAVMNSPNNSNNPNNPSSPNKPRRGVKTMERKSQLSDTNNPNSPNSLDSPDSPDSPKCWVYVEFEDGEREWVELPNHEVYTNPSNPSNPIMFHITCNNSSL